MICTNCKAAADDLATARKNNTATPATVATAIAQHGLCRGGTWCDCRHRVRKTVTA